MKNILVDAHIDLAYNAVVLGRDVLQPVAEIRAAEHQAAQLGGLRGAALVSVPDLLRGHVAVVGASIFVAPAFRAWQHEPQVYHTPEEAYVQAVAQLDYYRRVADERTDVRLLQQSDDLDTVLASWETDAPQLGLYVVMEGAEAIREPGELEWWVERGLRGVGLTWSAGTRYAGGSSAPGGITDEGYDLLAAMADYNMLLDVSHAWETAVYAALDRYPGPLVATHANPRAFVDTPRQLSDDVIRRIVERGGVVGSIPYNRMLQGDWRVGEPRLPLGRFVQVMDHVCQITGQVTGTGIGSDFDGGFGRESVPEGIDSIADLGKVAALLRARGYAKDDIKHILRDNWLRVMRETLV